MKRSISKQLLNTYASESTIHGVRYIVGGNNEKRSIRIFWICAFLLSIIGLGYYAYGVYMKWSTNPDIGLTLRLRPMREIPFPAITICSPLFARDSLANFSNFYAEFNAKSGKIIPFLSPKEQNYLAANVQACSPTSSSTIMKACNNRSDKNFPKLLRESSLDVSELFAACRFKKNYMKCEKILSRVLTNNGYCYTLNIQGYHTLFNSEISQDFESYRREKITKSFDEESKLFNKTFDDEKDKKETSTVDSGYKTNDDDVFPIRAIKINQLSVYMKLTEAEATNLCLSQGKGYKIIFHLPNEIPTPFHDEYFIAFNFERMMTLTAKSIRADPDLKKYSPAARRCYFDDERKLKFFRSYTKKLCDYECLTNFTLRKCGCVKFSMPRDDQTPVCDLDKAKCYFNAMMIWPDKDEIEKEGITPCDCLPTCSDVQYSIKLDKEAELEANIRLAHLKNRDESNIYSRMAIRFNDHSIEEQENFVAYKLQNFISDFGGLLGLFMGCSLLSIVELIFHCIRACINRRGRNEMKLEKSADENNQKDCNKVHDHIEFYHQHNNNNNDECCNVVRNNDAVTVVSINKLN